MPQWNFDHHDSDQWEIANWANGAPFNNAWSPDNVDFGEGCLRIRLDDRPIYSTGLPYTSGEYRSHELFGHGQFEVVMKVPSQSGVISSFFLYTDGGDGHPHDEIDIEFLGRNTRQVQFNYYSSDQGAGVNEFTLDLPFDAAEDFHSYAIRWQPGRIDWLVDGAVAHSDDGTRTGVPVPNHSMKIMMNMWTGSGVENWLGPFQYETPLTAHYRSAGYI